MMAPRLRNSAAPLPARDQGDGMTGGCKAHAKERSLHARAKDDNVHVRVLRWNRSTKVQMLPLNR